MTKSRKAGVPVSGLRMIINERQSIRGKNWAKFAFDQI